MPVKLQIGSDSSTGVEQREVLARRVLERFGGEIPGLRVLCFLDEEDWPFLREQYPYSRGFFTPCCEYTFPEWGCWPDYLQEAVTRVDPRSFRVSFTFDAVIYLHGSTCADETGLAMTLAHELQHAVQYVNRARVWAENILVTNLPKEVFNSLALKAFDLPIELEARIVSKQVAEYVCGRDIVNRYIARRIENAIYPDDREDWEFVQQLAPLAACDIASETHRLFSRLAHCRSQLEEALNHFSSVHAFQDIDLDSLLIANGED